MQWYICNKQRFLIFSNVEKSTKNMKPSIVTWDFRHKVDKSEKCDTLNPTSNLAHFVSVMVDIH